ncbi:30S ribosomal protein S16 [Candidatus Peregrinibacteria bacterium]|nr:MAG: 30S ribosomal protein S16 [Candidatus Peregrinibacteria bacterium]
MLKIRLQRKGRKRMPVFHIVLAEHTAPVQGKFIEKLGMFMAKDRANTLELRSERILYWISQGAQPSQTVARLLVKNGMKECEKFVPQRKQVAPKPAPVVEKAEVVEEASAETAAE